jgi:hypothetical protein
MEIYYITYGIVFFSIFFDLYKYDDIRWKKVILAIIIIILTIFNGLRWGTGADWAQWLDTFHRSEWSNIFSLSRYGNQNVEPGYVLMNVIPKTIINHYSFYLIVTNLARFILHAYIAFKISKRYPIIVFVWLLAFCFIFPDRDIFAISLFMLAYLFIIERRLKPFVVTWLLACSIHFSAIILFPVYFLYGRRLSFPMQIIIVCSAFIMTSAIVSIISPIAMTISMNIGGISTDLAEKAITYTTSGKLITEGYVSPKSYANLILAIFWILVFNFARQRNSLSRREATDMDFFILCYVISRFFSFGFQDGLEGITRYSHYFFTFPFLIPYVMNVSKKYMFLVLIFFVCYFSLRLKGDFTGLYYDVLVPYRTVFS